MQGVKTGEELYTESVSGLGAGRAGEEESDEGWDKVCV